MGNSRRNNANDIFVCFLSYRNCFSLFRSLFYSLVEAKKVKCKYDDAGVRTEKVVNGVKTEFVTSGIQVLAQKTGNDIITWQIDGSGSVLGFVHNDAVYYYIKNAQGDVVGIVDETGVPVAEYVYDSWGKIVNEDTLWLFNVLVRNVFL